MKNNKRYIITLFIAFGLIINSCDTNSEEYKSVSPVDSFVTTSISVIIPENATEYSFDIIVQASETYTADRSIPIEIGSNSTANGLEYTFSGNVNMVKGELSASTLVELDTDLISSSVEKTIVLKLPSTSEEITITYIKECNANKINLFIDFDNFSAETSWQITNSASAVVASSGYSGGIDITNEQISLPDGDYTFTIIDSYGDGICCSWGNGSYKLSAPACTGGAVFASGASFGSSESTQFSLP